MSFTATTLGEATAVSDAVDDQIPRKEVEQPKNTSQPFLSPANEAFYKSNTYKSLRSGRQEIRLCKFVFDTRNEHLQLELFQPVSLLNKPTYVAASYCAGSASDARKILVNGVSFNVFASVYGLLEVLEEKRVSHYLWIDQICIDQSNLDERTQQVLLMREVYTGSLLTCIWLGPDGLNLAPFTAKLVSALSDYIIELAHVLYNAKTGQDLTQELSDVHPALWKTDFVNQFTMLLSSPVENDYPTILIGDLLLACFRFFLDFQWWTRCWTLQEAVLPPEILFFCGKAELVWKHFVNVQKALHLLTFTQERDCTVLNVSAAKLNTNVIADYDELRRQFSTTGVTDICSVLQLIRRRECSDKRDKIYSTLGLINMADRLSPSYDPSDDLESSIVDFVAQIIGKGKNLSILRHACRPAYGNNLDLPTWVPDLTEPRCGLDVQLWDMPADGLQEFDASFLNCTQAVDDKTVSRSRPKGSLRFLSDAHCRQNRVLSCLIMDLGPVSSQAILSPAVGFESWNKIRKQLEVEGEILLDRNRDIDRIINQKNITYVRDCYRKCIESAGLGPNLYHIWPQPKCESMDDVIDKCLQRGAPENFPKSDFLGSVYVVFGLKHLEVFTETHLQWFNERLFVTSERTIGVGPASLKADDRLVIAIDSPVPLILRQKQDMDPEEDFELVGECYLYGSMQGQAVYEYMTGKREGLWKEIRIH